MLPLLVLTAFQKKWQVSVRTEMDDVNKPTAAKSNIRNNVGSGTAISPTSLTMNQVVRCRVWAPWHKI